MRAIRFVAAHPLFTLLVGTTLPSAISAYSQYVATGGVTGTWPIYGALIGGIVSTVILLSARRIQVPSNAKVAGQAPVTPMEPQRENASEEIERPTLPLGPFDLSDDRIFSPRTPSEMINEVQGKTSLEAERISRRHAGQWLRVEGSVRDVDSFLDLLTVSLSPSPTQPRIRLYFDPELWETQLAALNPGDRIIAEGRIDSISTFSVSLEDCLLLT